MSAQFDTASSAYLTDVTEPWPINLQVLFDTQRLDGYKHSLCGRVKTDCRQQFIINACSLRVILFSFNILPVYPKYGI